MDVRGGEVCEERRVGQSCETDLVDPRMVKGEECLAVIGRQRLLYAVLHHPICEALIRYAINNKRQCTMRISRNGE